jgi:hypothetical protein
LKENASTAGAVQALIERLLDSLPTGAAELAVEHDEGSGARYVTLTPSNRAAAPIHVDVSNDSDVVTLTIGRGAIFEVPLNGHRYSGLPYLEEVRAICLAAIRGEVEETVWLKGDSIVGGSARAKIGSTTVGDSWKKLFTNPLRRATKKSFSYRPYVED